MNAKSLSTNKQTQESSLLIKLTDQQTNKHWTVSLQLNLPAMELRLGQSLRDLGQCSTTSCHAPKDCALACSQDCAGNAARTAPGLRPGLWLECVALSASPNCTGTAARTLPGLQLECASWSALPRLPRLTAPGLRPGLPLDCALDCSWGALAGSPRPGTRHQDL